MFSDLESDYINPIDMCNKLNQVRLDPFVASPSLGADWITCSVHTPRTYCTRFPCSAISTLWSMDSISTERAFACI